VARVRVKVPIENPPAPAERPKAAPVPAIPDSNGDASIAATHRTIKLSKILIIIGFVLTVVFILNLINDRNELKKKVDSPQVQEYTEATKLTEEIGKHVELPVGEAPTIALISDADKVKTDNPALSDIKNGDKMLFFTRARKVVIYRPSTQKVVVVLSIADPTAIDQSKPSASPSQGPATNQNR
jgi:hypothetical protein